MQIGGTYGSYSCKNSRILFWCKRAVDTVYEQLENASEFTTIYTYGPIIHNEEVVKDMKQKGVIVLQSEADWMH
mgnify:CR=1 FL=1